jgi:F5/8 type C domain
VTHPTAGRLARALVPLLLGLGLLIGCSSGSGGVEVRPFREVQDGELGFVADPGDPSRGIFRVRTTEPMICAIVWGEDEALGRFNNSLAMNGTGIVDHDVFLPDIEYGRTYTFVVQGTTADGTLYRSEPSTFVIDPPPAAAEPGPERPTGPNLALGATVTAVSSEFSEQFSAEKAIDGDEATEWATAGDGDGAYLEVELDQPASLQGVEFVTRSMADGTAITTTFTVSVDGGPPSGPFPASTLAHPAVAELDVEGRSVRVVVDSSTGGNVGAVELRLYGR